jgi:hypothetical protein
MPPLLPQILQIQIIYSNKNPFVVGGLFVILDSDVASSSFGPFASSLPLFFSCIINPSNDQNHTNLM